MKPERTQVDMFAGTTATGRIIPVRERAEQAQPEVHNDAHDTEREWAGAAGERWRAEGMPGRVYDLADCPEGVTGWEAAKALGKLDVEWSVRPILSKLKKDGILVVTRWRRRNGRGAREVVYVSKRCFDLALHSNPSAVRERAS